MERNMKKIWMMAVCSALLMGCNNIPGDTNVPSGTIENIPISNEEEIVIEKEEKIVTEKFVAIQLKTVELQNVRREGDSLVFGLIYKDPEGNIVHLDKKIWYLLWIEGIPEGKPGHSALVCEETGILEGTDAEISVYLPLNKMKYVRDMKWQDKPSIGLKFLPSSHQFPGNLLLGLRIEAGQDSFSILYEGTEGQPGGIYPELPLDPALLGIGSAE